MAVDRWLRAYVQYWKKKVGGDETIPGIQVYVGMYVHVHTSTGRGVALHLIRRFHPAVVVCSVLHNSVSRIEVEIWGEEYAYDFQLRGMCGGRRYYRRDIA